MNKFSEFADTTISPIMDGKKVSLDDILDKEISVLRYRIKKTKFSEAKNPDCLTVQFAYPENENTHFVFFSFNATVRKI
jgi:hypothetical protein